MEMHVDHIHSLFDGERKGIPALSILGLLNDDFDGGEFVMWDEDMKLNAGDIIIFPSNFLYPHKVNTITNGERYSVINWAW
jgi:predicted 2-oxoglutarate/Fe(II)-dependent dioxygenase YbiX